MKRFAVCLLLAGSLIVAGCGGQTPVVPSPVGFAPEPSARTGGADIPVVSLASIRRAARRQHRRGRATFAIRIPRKKHRGRRVRPRYVSAATQSIAIAVDGGTPQIVNLTPSSPDCAKTSASYLQCEIEVNAPVGEDTFSLTTYDRTGGTGNVLSANTDVKFNVAATGNTPVNVTLGGVPATIEMVLPGVVVASSKGIIVYGDITFSAQVWALDADGNMILGPGAPTVSLTPSSGAPVKLSRVSANAWNVTSTYKATNPLKPASLTLTSKVAPVANTGGKTLTYAVPFSFYQPWLYLTNLNSGPPDAVQVFDEYGNVIPNVASKFKHVPAPSGIAYDPQNKWVYVASIEGDVCVYGVLGQFIADASGAWSDLGYPWAIAYSPVTSWLYAGNNEIATITAYDGYGTQQTPSAAKPFENAGYVDGMVADSHNQWIYSTDGVGETLKAYDAQGNTESLPSLPSPPVVPAQPNGIAFDSNNNLLYVAYGNGSGATGVGAFSESGAPQALPRDAFAGLDFAFGITYDPYDGLLYVVDQSLNEVFAYDEEGNAQSFSGFPSNGYNAWGITVVP